MSSQRKSYWGLVVVILLTIITIAGLISWDYDVFAPPSAVVASATIPTAAPLLGEVELYRFTVSAEDNDIIVDKIYFVSDPELFLRHPQLKPHLYDYDSGDELAGMFENISFRYKPVWPLKIGKGTTKTFVLRGTVMWPGKVIIWIDDLILKEGKATGLPTAATTVMVGGQREQGR